MRLSLVSIVVIALSTASLITAGSTTGTGTENLSTSGPNANGPSKAESSVSHALAKGSNDQAEVKKETHFSVETIKAAVGKLLLADTEKIVHLFNTGNKDQIKDTRNNGNVYSISKYDGKKVVITEFGSKFSATGFWLGMFARETSEGLVGWTVTSAGRCYMVRLYGGKKSKEAEPKAHL